MNIRKFMRGIILPVEDIKKTIISANMDFSNQSILDFGAGTLFWSEWFANNLNAEVIALDNLYEKVDIHNCNKKIEICSSIEKINNVQNFSMIFVCDVLHHLDEKSMNEILSYFTEHSNFIVIKDIDANDTLGNIQNQLHDFIINHQCVKSIYPDKLLKIFEDKGYRVNITHHKKFGYPHFLITAIK